ncbi:MAG: hypothetical protein LBL84_01480, partial [Candidatus Nomurabacteria bacterium]|nr:hypothetical protein [Candidatus Nomurabacteria bacterium]
MARVKGSRTGHYGWVTLVSPSGEKDRLYLPRRKKGQSGVAPAPWTNWECEHTPQFERRFSRLLSAGWRVASTAEAEVEQPEPVEELVEDCKTEIEIEVAVIVGQVGEESKKDTDQVDGSVQEGDDSHGGDNASGEVENSPNACENGTQAKRITDGALAGGEKRTRQGEIGVGGDKTSGQGDDDPDAESEPKSQDDGWPKRQRGSRGGRGEKAKERRKQQKKADERQTKASPLRVQKCAQTGHNPVIALQPMRISEDEIKWAEQSAVLLSELVGRSVQKTR